MKDKIKALLEKEFPNIDFSDNIELINDGVIDSLTLSVIITILSIEFDIMIPQTEIKEENFNSIDSMVAMVERLKIK